MKKCCGECIHVCRFHSCVKKCDTPDCPCHTEKPVQNYERDHSHSHCFEVRDGQEGHRTHLRCCICYKEKPERVNNRSNTGAIKPVQEYSYADMVGDPLPVQDVRPLDPANSVSGENATRLAGLAAPVQDKNTNGHDGCSNPNCECNSSVGEAWEEEFDKQFYYHGEYVEEPRERIKSFIRSQIEQAEKNVTNKCKSAFQHGKNTERSRLLEAVGKLRRKVNGYEDVDPDAAFNHALDEVLKILSGEGV